MIEIHLKKKPKWYLEEINPNGMVPVIDHDNHIIRESAVTFGEQNNYFNCWPCNAGTGTGTGNV